MMMDGWSGGIVNVDFSPTVIQQMNRRYSQTFYDKLNTSRSSNLSITCQPMTFCCADVTRQIPYPDESFDLVVVKGALDAILCSSGSIANARRMMKETCRVLRSEHGAMMVVTNGNPDNRLVYFENEGDEWWDGVSVHTIPRPAHKIQSSDAAK
jgi:ubiquinone/menaquinone biosynthesis C-methylase UbiE